MWSQVIGNGLGKLLSLLRKEKGKGGNCANSLEKNGGILLKRFSTLNRVETVRLPTGIWE